MNRVLYKRVVQKLKNSCLSSSRSYCASTERHVYDEITPFETNRDLANYLCDNILYNANGIIVFNKPYGIAFSRDAPQWKKQTVVKDNKIIKHKIDTPDYNPNIITASDKVNLYDALPHIKSRLNCDTLTVIKSPEKYTSGVSIFGRSEEIRTKVKKCWEKSRAEKIPLESYLAICRGVPIKKYIKDLRIGITVDVSEKGHSRKAILTQEYTNKSVLESKVKVATVHSSLVSTNADETASIVLLTASQKKWHFVRLFLATHLLSPAIGDHQFSSRVKSVFGHTVLVNHWNELTSQMQKLSPELLSLLDLRKGSEKYIPVMIHLNEVKLIGYPKTNKWLTLNAPAPTHFQWTADKLGLQLPINKNEIVVKQKYLNAVN